MVMLMMILSDINHCKSKSQWTSYKLPNWRHRFRVALCS